jgi:rfaE bifunctional protein nucleotidyltransferase chain/domain
MTLPLPAFETKVVQPKDLLLAVSKLPRPLVFTNGVFDILHRGHASYLAQARHLGASLVVGVNTDASVRLLGKGSDRPINQEDDRQALLAALASVDLVVLFNEATPLHLIAQIRPDIYVKGGDYTLETINQDERRAVENGGGRIAFLKFVEGKSTTGLIAKIQRL